MYHNPEFYPLNRTILELKPIIGGVGISATNALNRTILELKHPTPKPDPDDDIALNRTILELKQQYIRGK